MVGTILGALFAVFLLFLVGQALWGPLRFLLRLLLRAAMGGLALFLIDSGSPALGLELGAQPGQCGHSRPARAARVAAAGRLQVLHPLSLTSFHRRKPLPLVCYN